MALAWVLVAVLSIGLPLGFIMMLLRLVNRVPSRACRALADPLAEAPGLGLGGGAALAFGTRLDSDLDLAGMGQETATRGPERAPERHMP